MSYNLRVFSWLVICQGLQMKYHLAKSGMSNDHGISRQKVENVKHILWECSFESYCCVKVQYFLENVLQVHLYWKVALLGDARSMI